MSQIWPSTIEEKSEQEVEERRTVNTPYGRIREALEELGATSLPSEK